MGIGRTSELEVGGTVRAFWRCSSRWKEHATVGARVEIQLMVGDARGRGGWPWI